jgi:hypothetical protein
MLGRRVIERCAVPGVVLRRRHRRRRLRGRLPGRGRGERLVGVVSLAQRAAARPLEAVALAFLGGAFVPLP